MNFSLWYSACMESLNWSVCRSGDHHFSHTCYQKICSETPGRWVRMPTCITLQCCSALLTSSSTLATIVDSPSTCTHRSAILLRQSAQPSSAADQGSCGALHLIQEDNSPKFSRPSGCFATWNKHRYHAWTVHSIRLCENEVLWKGNASQPDSRTELHSLYLVVTNLETQAPVGLALQW